MSNKTKIEICVNSAEGAMQAQKAGAQRIVLCAGSVEKGTTPSFGSIRMARQILDEAELYVWIRPRGGDYTYSPLEQEVMLHDVKVARQLGANGVVFACLTADHRVDIGVLKKLMNGVGEMEVTFYEAFDACPDPQEAIQQLAAAGVKRVQTNGRGKTAAEGAARIKELSETVEGHIIPVPYGGVTPDNLETLAEQSGCREFHIESSSVTDKDESRQAIDTEFIHNILLAAQKVNEKDAALEKLLKEAKAKKKKGRRSEDDDDDDI